MTVSYQYDVASTSHGGFIRLLFKWKGSVWKLVYTELLLLTLAYGFLSLLYRQALNEPQKRFAPKPALLPTRRPNGTHAQSM
ncbi:hypothetical protein HPB50_003588 [Hyalomma asiaticum]|uniref:Uncharacterized protein n=1 Tax=Hyalomma asiaticum TaxID=266040 RepID=A0ACB7SS78_HYAAI|nr:hypothetical protein HPB50_003588 [Hyalomma asiaticum]